MPSLIKKNNILETVKQLDKENSVGNIAGDVAPALERKVEEIMKDAIKRAKANGRRTLYARDL